MAMQSSFWRRQALISGPCDQHFSDLHQHPLGFTPKACFFCRKIQDLSNSVRFCNISVRPGDHAPFLETHGHSVRLGMSAKAFSIVFSFKTLFMNTHVTQQCMYSKKNISTSEEDNIFLRHIQLSAPPPVTPFKQWRPDRVDKV